MLVHLGLRSPYPPELNVVGELWTVLGCRISQHQNTKRSDANRSLHGQRTAVSCNLYSRTALKGMAAITESTTYPYPNALTLGRLLV